MAPVRAVIRKTGLITPVGLGSGQTCAAIRAGVPGFRETPVHDKNFEPFVMALFPDEELPELEESLSEVAPGLTARQARMLRLAAPALAEALEGIAEPGGVAVFLAGPEPLEDRPDPMAGEFLSYLARQAGVDFDLAASRTFPTGRAGGLLALQAAIQALESGQAERVLVGGIDTYLDLYLLGTLDQQSRIQSSQVMDGLIPGEAAAFLLVSDPSSEGVEPLAGVLALAVADEPGHRGSEEPYRGDGLANAFSAALAESGNGGVIQTVFAGLTGENLGAKEWGVAFLRNHASFAEEHRLEHPADCVGDTGAASGPLMLALAALGLHDGSVEGPCLVWCSSDGSGRAAATLGKTS